MELDYTQMITYQLCPQRYYLKFVLGLEKRQMDERDIDKNFGQVTHTGLAHLYKGEPAKVLVTFDDFADLPIEVEKHKTKVNGRALLKSYVEHYALEDNGIEVLDVEAVYVYPLSKKLNWVTKVDTVIKKMGNIYGLEHKTTKKMDYRYFSRFSPNTQVTGQTFAIGMKFGMCSGIIVNVLQSGWRERAYRGEPAGFHCKFQREIVNRTPEQVEDFRENACLWAKRIEESKRTGVYGKDEGSCHTYRGCQYKELCLTSKGTELDEEIKETLYETKDPLEYLEEKKDEV